MRSGASTRQHRPEHFTKRGRPVLGVGYLSTYHSDTYVTSHALDPSDTGTTDEVGSPRQKKRSRFDRSPGGVGPAPSRRGLGRLSRSTCALLGVVFLGYLLSLGFEPITPHEPSRRVGNPLPIRSRASRGPSSFRHGRTSVAPRSPVLFGSSRSPTRPGSTSCIFRG